MYNISLNGWKGNVISGLILLALTSGASGLLVATKLAWGQEAHLKDHEVVKAKVDQLWEEGIRQEATNRDVQEIKQYQREINQKLDRLLASRPDARDTER